MSTAPYLRLNPQDQVAIAYRDLESGTPLENSTCQDLIPAGHKVALAAIASGESVRRYGQIIGVASRAIAPGQHVHVHNLAMGEHDRDYRFGDDYVPAPADPGVTFFGIFLTPVFFYVVRWFSDRGQPTPELSPAKEPPVTVR